MATSAFLVPIYDTRGDVGAVLVYPHLYNRLGEWIGWIGADRHVFSVHGHYVGWLTNEPRILRKQSDAHDRSARQMAAPPQQRISLPANFPLAPMMAELTYGTIDVLQDDPDLLPSVDFGDLRQDMD